MSGCSALLFKTHGLGGCNHQELLSTLLCQKNMILLMLPQDIFPSLYPLLESNPSNPPALQCPSLPPFPFVRDVCRRKINTPWCDGEGYRQSVEVCVPDVHNARAAKLVKASEIPAPISWSPACRDGDSRVEVSDNRVGNQWLS